jgi:hypothetical protein
MIYRLAITNGFLAISNAAQPAPDKLMPKRIVSMQYPVLALLATMQGKITLIATVSQHGEVQQIREPTRQNAVLAEAAKAALSKWLFGGCSASETCDVTIVFTFVLSGDPRLIDSCRTEFQVDLPDQVQVTSQPAVAIIN